ncbi:unnamed protein product [Psylliodes chrysocephalus]|uniref:Uncharacterized protein n=1 Tax=Psylliodes chrysocephalus TaxID=3402493 RepID=A0A9P0CZ99_9CUCU|nr:unnamed protein product [Psylliodes chrysocephala]
MKITLGCILLLIAIALAKSEPLRLDSIINGNDDGTYRFKRSPQEKPWEISHKTNTDENGNINAGVNVKNKNLNVGWDQVFDGSGKSKPNLNIGGTYRFKRSSYKIVPIVRPQDDFSGQRKRIPRPAILY